MKGVNWFFGFLCGMLGAVIALAAFFVGAIIGVDIGSETKSKVTPHSGRYEWKGDHKQ